MEQYENYVPYSAGLDTTEAVNALFRKVYQFMAMGLIITAVAAYITASSSTMINMLFTSRAPLIILAVAEIGLVMFISAGINRISASTALILFMIYSLLNGMTCSVILLVYTSESVYKAFLATAGMFGAMSLYGIYTKSDLTSFGSFLYMGLIGIVIASLINMFVGSSMADFYISIFGVILFMGLTAYDTAKIKTMAMGINDNDGEITGKAAVIGALALYLDFINIFLYLLRLFGREKN